jgi:hypothetical protein
LKTFDIKYVNISSLTLLPSTTNLPLISGGKFGTGNFQTIDAFRYGPELLFTIERPDPSQNVSAVFCYTAAASTEQLVTWIWIPANRDIVDVKVW